MVPRIHVPVVGLHAKKYAGKDTGARFLCDAFNAEQYAFADPVYAGLAVALGVRRTDVVDKEDIIPKFGVSLRYMTTRFATDYARDMIHNDVWIQRAIEWMQRLSVHHGWKDIPPIVFSDVRFENEAKFIRDMGGTVIHVYRSGFSDVESDHESEDGIRESENDFILYNNGNLSDYKTRLRRVYEVALIRRPLPVAPPSYIDFFHALEKSLERKKTHEPC